MFKLFQRVTKRKASNQEIPYQSLLDDLIKMDLLLKGLFAVNEQREFETGKYTMSGPGLNPGLNLSTWLQQDGAMYETTIKDFAVKLRLELEKLNLLLPFKNLINASTWWKDLYTKNLSNFFMLYPGILIIFQEHTPQLLLISEAFNPICPKKLIEERPIDAYLMKYPKPEVKANIPKLPDEFKPAPVPAELLKKLRRDLGNPNTFMIETLSVFGWTKTRLPAKDTATLAIAKRLLPLDYPIDDKSENELITMIKRIHELFDKSATTDGFLPEPIIQNFYKDTLFQCNAVIQCYYKHTDSLLKL